MHRHVDGIGFELSEVVGLGTIRRYLARVASEGLWERDRNMIQSL